MAIRSVILRGYGNGTFNGTIPLVSTRGYAIGDVTVLAQPGAEFRVPLNRPHFRVPDNRPHFRAEEEHDS